MMKIAILGGGKIGSTFAYQLAKAGHNVTVIARPGSARFGQLQSDGGVMLKSGDSVATRVLDQLDEQTAYDLIVVTMYDFQVDAVIPALQRSKAAAIQFMFVTFNPERLRIAVGQDRCSFGMPAVMAQLDAEGKLNPKISSRQKTLHGDRRWMELFIGAGIPSAFDPDMPLWLKCHVPLTVAMESISVIACRKDGAASWSEATMMARGMRSAYVIIKALGNPIYPGSKRVIASLPSIVVTALLRFLSGNKNFRELLANGAREARGHVDTMLAAAAALTPALPAEVEAVSAMRPAEDK